jgi:hypothetical protein
MLSKNTWSVRGLIRPRLRVVVFVGVSSLILTLSVGARRLVSTSVNRNIEVSATRLPSATNGSDIRQGKPLVVPTVGAAGFENSALLDGSLIPSSERSVTLNFDTLASGTTVDNLYPDISFSSPAGNVKA